MQTAQSILVITINPTETIKNKLGFSPDLSHADFLKIENEKSVGIDDVRNIQSFANHPPLQTKQKTVLILNAQNLTLEAQNALLKLLEEPPSFLKIILTAPHIQNFVDTLLSRCQITYDSGHTQIAKSTGTLNGLLKCPVPSRLGLIPFTKSKEAAITYCHTLITESEMLLQDNSSIDNTHNLQLLHHCLNCLSRNGNPTMILSDAILHLQASSHL